MGHNRPQAPRAMANVPFPAPTRAFVESTSWTFAMTYAGTSPLEYVV